MAFSLIPREEKFFELFEAQAAHNVQAAKVFKELAHHWSLESPLFDKLRDIYDWDVALIRTAYVRLLVSAGLVIAGYYALHAMRYLGGHAVPRALSGHPRAIRSPPAAQTAHSAKPDQRTAR